jgi:DNA-binding PadR family transcriptional regulator
MWHHKNHEDSNTYRHCGPRGRFRGWGGHGRHGFGAGGEGFGGFSRRRGLYDSEELRLVLLSLIAEQPRHGYDLIREIEERTAGQYAPSPGVIYPTLTMLQDMGLIAEDGAAGTRKVYAATEDGKAHLAQNKDEVATLMARITELKNAQKGDHAPVRRAMRNLIAALSEKVARTDNEETIHKIAGLLDEVTQKIERS